MRIRTSAAVIALATLATGCAGMFRKKDGPANVDALLDRVEHVQAEALQGGEHARGAYEELYDLAADPGERHNLAGDPHPSPAVGSALRELRGRLERWLAGLGDTESVDAAGHLRLDRAARGWAPLPPPRTGLGLRPY